MYNKKYGICGLILCIGSFSWSGSLEAAQKTDAREKAVLTTLASVYSVAIGAAAFTSWWYYREYKAMKKAPQVNSNSRQRILQKSENAGILAGIFFVGGLCIGRALYCHHVYN